MTCCGSALSKSSARISFNNARMRFFARKRRLRSTSKAVTACPELSKHATTLFPINPRPTTPIRAGPGPACSRRFVGRLGICFDLLVTLNQITFRHTSRRPSAVSVSGKIQCAGRPAKAARFDAVIDQPDGEPHAAGYLGGKRQTPPDGKTKYKAEARDHQSG